MTSWPTIVISSANLSTRLGLDPKVWVSRPRGRAFLPALISELQRNGALAINVLDLHEIDLMDASFADETFGTIAAIRRRPRDIGCLLLRSIEPSSYDNLEMALQSRPMRDRGIRNCVLPVIDQAGDLRLVGKTEESVAETFHLLRQHRLLTARELASARAIDIVAASTRLKVLFDLGLACRVEDRDAQGKLFRYGFPLTSKAD